MMPRTALYRRLRRWIVALALGLALIGSMSGPNTAAAANWSTGPAAEPPPVVESHDVTASDSGVVEPDANWSTGPAS
ncbi:MAG: hypothetical protein HXY39_15385 [Chloroflexi bacterium]|nr:hypothetical protein [Chloroflexota bacterium]